MYLNANAGTGSLFAANTTCVIERRACPRTRGSLRKTTKSNVARSPDAGV